MKNTSKRMRISILATVSALALSGVAFASSAFATDTTAANASATASATAIISPTLGDSTLDSELNAEIDAQGSLDGILGAGQSSVSISDNQGNQEESNVEVVNNENAQEQASFNDDINAAVQAGDSEDAAQLSTAASIVASITLPEVHAMASDDTEAHVLITGVLQK